MGKPDRRRRSRDAPPPAPAARGWRRHAWRLLAIWGLALVAYSNSFQAGLVFDNASVISEDPRIREAAPQNIQAILTGGYWYGKSARAATSGLYRPFTTFTYLLNYAVLGDGPRPAGYHVLNFLLHAVNVTLVYALGVLVFGELAPAWALAALWGLHPLLTESVTNIVGRADLLAAFGVLAGLLCHVKGVSAAGRRRVVWLAGLAAAQAVGLFSKENAAVLPGIMLLYDLTWSKRATWRRSLPAYAAVALPLAAFFCVRSVLHTHMRIEFTENPMVGAGFWTARLTAVKVVGMFLGLFLWPAHLSADYTYNAVPLFGWRVSNWEDAKALIALAVCLGAALLAAALAARRRRAEKPLLFFLVFFVVAMSPTSNLIVLIGSVMAERFLYLPSVGLAGCVVAAIYALGKRRLLQRPAAAPVAWAALGLVCLAFTARTYARNFDWQDDLSLWASAVAACPRAARPHYNLAIELERIPDRLPEAIAEYQAALRIEPDHAEAHNNLANALARTPGQLPEAVAEYQAALRIRPDSAAVHFNLANALAQMPTRLPEAIAEYQEALRNQPLYADAHNALANALARMPGRLSEAIAEYQAALRIQPDYAEAHANLGNTLARIPGRMLEAIAELRAALRIQPDRTEVHFSLANTLAQMPGRLPEAIAEYQAALRIVPDFAEARVNLGNTLAQSPGRLPEAIAEYEAALKIRPDPQLQQIVDRLRASSPAKNNHMLH